MFLILLQICFQLSHLSHLPVFVWITRNSLPLFYGRRWFICSVYLCVCVQWGIWCRKDGEHKKSDSVFGTCGVLTQVWHSGTAQRHRPTGEDGGLAEDFRERKSSFCILLFYNKSAHAYLSILLIYFFIFAVVCSSLITVLLHGSTIRIHNTKCSNNTIMIIIQKILRIRLG